MYVVYIQHPYGGTDTSSAETRQEAQRIAKSERDRNPLVTTRIERF